jgi:hypothetical protein
MFFFGIFLLFALYLATPVDARLRGDECQVCITVVNKFMEASKKKKYTKLEEIEGLMKKMCQKQFADKKDKRFCYYVGGSADSATGLLREISRPINYGMPAETICERLKKKDLAICELVYPGEREEQVKVADMDFSKMRVKQLKQMLRDWGEKCKGCTSKQDYIDRIRAVGAQHQEL